MIAVRHFYRIVHDDCKSGNPRINNLGKESSTCDSERSCWDCAQEACLHLKRVVERAHNVPGFVQYRGHRVDIYDEFPPLHQVQQSLSVKSIRIVIAVSMLSYFNFSTARSKPSLQSISPNMKISCISSHVWAEQLSKLQLKFGVQNVYAHDTAIGRLCETQKDQYHTSLTNTWQSSPFYTLTWDPSWRESRVLSQAHLGKKHPSFRMCQILHPVTRRGTSRRSFPLNDNVCQAPKDKSHRLTNLWKPSKITCNIL